jgi:DNA-directed RNA polymerase specialized sigma24 family protein
MHKGEFVDFYKPFVPELDKYFHTCLNNAQYKGNYNKVKYDLIGLTCCEAYDSCKTETFSDIEVKALLFRKARNAWLNLIHHKKNKFCTIDIIDDPGYSDPEPFYEQELRKRLDLLKTRIPPGIWCIIELLAEDKKYKEIAMIMNDTTANLKKKMSRLRKELREEGLNYL